MNGKRKQKTHALGMEASVSNRPLSRNWRWGLSVLILLQLLAVVAEPFRFFTLSNRGTSPAADPPRNLLGPYIEFAYLNHGYFFFAPEPGPSHLIECRFPGQQGNTLSVRYPDRSAQWPRLLYHRHFMLTENLHQFWVPPVDTNVVENAQDLARNWRAERRRYEQVRDSMLRHVAAKFDASDVELDRVEHRLPSDLEVFEQGVALDDPKLYVILQDVGVPQDAVEEAVPQQPEVGEVPGKPEGANE